MKNFFLIIAFFSLVPAFAQREIFFEYSFKLYTHGHKKEISNKSKSYSIVRLFNPDDQLKYTAFEYRKPLNCWKISEPGKTNGTAWIQIVHLKTKDTMNVFINSNDRNDYSKPNTKPKMLAYDLDKIVFTKGNFRILAETVANDWFPAQNTEKIKAVTLEAIKKESFENP